MKNIRILPTDKPSRLYTVDSIGKLDWSEGYLPQIDGGRNQHIYITDDSEIKDGDYGICLKLVREGFKSHQAVFKMDLEQRQAMEDLGGQKKAKVLKIILTTDQDLIKDGVQEIDDKFLEWFVKNPNCERVDIETMMECEKCGKEHCDNLQCRGYKDIPYYKIIIPKEEPKQKTLTNDTDSHSWGFENFEVIKTEEDVKIFVETMENIPEPNNKLKKAFKDFNKQETLEEAMHRYPLINQRIGFKKGAKWQQERMYSEEEVKHLMTLAFEQGFKKADIVEAGLEAKETDTEVNWIFLKHKK